MRRTTTVPLYETTFIVIISPDDPNTAARKAKLLAPLPTKYNSTLGLTHLSDDMSYTAVFLKPNANINTIAHEAFHAAQCIAEQVGLDWDFDEEKANEELAYLTGWAATELDRRLREYRRLTK